LQQPSFLTAEQRRSRRPNTKHIGDLSERDFFAVYCPDTQKVYLVPESHLTRSLGSLRVTPTLNNVRKTVRWAADYVLP
jgi:hypothetical protein